MRSVWVGFEHFSILRRLFNFWCRNKPTEFLQVFTQMVCLCHQRVSWQRAAVLILYILFLLHPLNLASAQTSVTLHHVDGTVVTGTLYRDNGNSFVIDSRYGRLTYAKEELSRVEFENPAPIIPSPAKSDSATSASPADQLKPLPVAAKFNYQLPSLPSESEWKWLQSVFAVISSVSSSVRALWPEEFSYSQIDSATLKRSIWELKQQAKRLSSLKAPSKRFENTALLLENARIAFEALSVDLSSQETYDYSSPTLSPDQMAKIEKGYFFIWQALWTLRDEGAGINCAYISALFVTPDMAAARTLVSRELERELPNIILRATETYLRDMFIIANTMEYPDLADKIFRKPKLQPLGVNVNIGDRIYDRGQYIGTVIGFFANYYDSESCFEYPLVMVSRLLTEGTKVQSVVEKHSLTTMRTLSRIETATDPIVLGYETQEKFTEYRNKFVESETEGDAALLEQKPVEEPELFLRSLGGRIDVGILVYKDGSPFGVVTGFTTNLSGVRLVEITKLDGSVSTFDRGDLIRNSSFSTPNRKGH